MKILHVGATGLVGQLVLARLLESPGVARVVAPTRRPLALRHPVLENPVVDFDALPADAPWWAVDAAICTLGTTLAVAVSRAAFRRVDHDSPLAVARLARGPGAGTLVLPYAMGGAAPSSGCVTRVVAPTRRPLALRHPVLENPVVDFDALPADAPWWAVDAAICTLGTTLAVAGSRDAFRRVDHDYPLAVARLARGQGARTFVLTSAMGADAHSSVFYNRVKGELEEAIAALDYPALVLVRPGLIDGERSERRPAEAAALLVSRALRPLLPAKWRPSQIGRAHV